MELTANGKVISNRPSDSQIKAALAGLNVNRDGEGFVILGLDDLTYIQVSGDQNIGFDMEYQEGNVAKHYRAAHGLIVG